jgi:hypothetical protein
MPRTAGTDITRAGIVDDFYNAITLPVNSAAKWHSGSNPGGVIQSGIVAGSTVTNYTPSSLQSNLLSGTTVSTSPTAGELAVGDASLGAVNTLLRNTAQVLSRSRNVRLMKYYGTSYGVATLAYDATNLAHMSSSWQIAIGSVPSLGGGEVTASAFNTFITNLTNTVTAHRNTTLTFTELWCHSNCHSNHSSRSRR